MTGIAAKIQLEREAIDRRIQQNGNRLQALQNAWQTLAGDKQWSDAALTEAVAGLRKDYENHQSAEQKLHQADTLLRELTVMEELGRLRAERKPIVAELILPP